MGAAVIRDRIVVAVGVAMLATGCMPARMVTMAPGPGPTPAFVRDATPPDAYPGFGAAEGNIYSCRYGIAFQKATEFDPAKARMFESLLASARPGIETRSVVLHRLDLYNNQRLKMLSTTGMAMGGALGYAIANRATAASGSKFVLDRLIVHVDPDPAYVPADENPVGCNGRGEGEYFASEIGAGQSVLVTWLKFDVDGTPYHFRTFYQHQAVLKDELEQAKAEALRLTVLAAADTISP